MPETRDRATRLLRLHRDEPLLSLVNVWDVASARMVAEAPGTRALATASQAIAEAHGYEDGEQIPVDLMLAAVGRIVAATSLPVTADLEAGYGDPVGTVRRAIGLGVVGANLEDEMRPVVEAARVVEQVVAAAAAEGVADFVLNARTDVFLRLGDRDRSEALADAVARGRAYLEAGAPVVFVPGRLHDGEVAALVEALGPRRLSVLGFPGTPEPARLEALGVARVSYGPLPHAVALAALREAVGRVAGGEHVSAG